MCEEFEILRHQQGVLPMLLIGVYAIFIKVYKEFEILHTQFEKVDVIFIKLHSIFLKVYKVFALRRIINCGF